MNHGVTAVAGRSAYLARDPASDGRLRLFCFHHAGGSASAFTGWAEPLAAAVDVLPVQLPGRENRVREPALEEIGELVGQLAAQLGPYLRAPYAFYGHSMGALVAYCLAAHQQAHSLPGPRVLAVGAYPAPHLPPPLDTVRLLPDGEFGEWLIGIGGMSPMLRDYPQWMRSAVALTRADLNLCHSFGGPGAHDAPLDCPIHAFNGDADPLMTDALARAWGRYTRSGCEVHTIPGGHLFPAQSREVFLDTLDSVLAGADAAGRTHEGRNP